MERRVPFSVNENYHVYNRGAHKSKIFNNTDDYDRFFLLLYLANDSSSLNFRELALRYKGRSFVEMFKSESVTKELVDVLAFSLMPNHFHVVLREKSENGIVRYMRKVATAYSMYFNAKYQHSGVLFQGRFKSQHIDSESYFRWIFSYVHLNPVELVVPSWEEKGIREPSTLRKFMRDYKYSSYFDYSVGTRPESVILAENDLPDFLHRQNDLEYLIETYTKDRPL